MSGEWLIRQPGVQIDRQGVTVRKHETERITIEITTSSRTEPSVDVGPTALIVEYADGRILIFPWHNILRAEYRPHPQP